MNRDHVFPELRSRGAVKAVVSFSGGNDEGGAEYIGLFDREDTEIAHLDPHKAYEGTRWNRETGQYERVTSDLEAELVEALTKPVYDTYHSFAGDFFVSGEVIWDVRDRTAIMKRNESIPQSQYDEVSF